MQIQFFNSSEKSSNAEKKRSEESNESLSESCLDVGLFFSALNC